MNASTNGLAGLAEWLRSVDIGPNSERFHRWATEVEAASRALTDEQIRKLALDSGFNFYGKWLLYQGAESELLAFARALLASAAPVPQHEARRPQDWLAPMDERAYECKCVDCGCIYVGHKRSAQCRKCAGAAPSAPLDEREAQQWRCFHCDAVFTDADAAREHFGPSEHAQPACQIDIAEYRRMQETHRRHCEDDTDWHRAFYKLGSDHDQSKRRHGDDEYARGLRDGVNLPADSPDRASLHTAAREPLLRCPLCGYQHGHAIGCVNNPLDIALAAGSPIHVADDVHTKEPKAAHVDGVTSDSTASGETRNLKQEPR